MRMFHEDMPIGSFVLADADAGTVALAADPQTAVRQTKTNKQQLEHKNLYILTHTHIYTCTLTFLSSCTATGAARETRWGASAPRVALAATRRHTD